MFFRSIRFRLTLWYLLTLAIVLAVFSTSLYLSIRDQLYSGSDASLLMIAESLASPTMEPFRETDSSVFDQVLEDFIGEKSTGKIIQLLAVDGSVRVHSSNFKRAGIRLSPKSLKEVGRGVVNFETVAGPEGFPYRVLAYPLYVNGKLHRIIQVGESLREPARTLGNILLAFSFTIPLALVVLAAGGWFLAGRALKPVDTMNRRIMQISADNLGERLRVANPDDEIGRLAVTCNAMLTRIEHAFAKVRQFSSDVSHELRTPLTILRGETEVALRWAKEPEQFREALQSSLEEITRLTNIIERLMELEKIELGSGTLNFEEIDLGELLDSMVVAWEERGRMAEVQVTVSAAEELYMVGDRARLRQLIGALLDNAIYASAPGDKVVLSASMVSGGGCMLQVSDTGCGIAPEHHAKLFDPFYRVDSARNRNDGGLGLGLSLVKALVTAHNGTIDVSSTLGSGTTLTITFPLPKSLPASL